jgi:hypothetical protein
MNEQNNQDIFECDRCDNKLPDGEGNYIGDDRVCDECAENATTTFRVIIDLNSIYVEVSAKDAEDAIEQALESLSEYTAEDFLSCLHAFVDESD